MSYNYEEVYKYPTCICLNVTDSCNLACKYCFVQQKPHFMTIDLAKQTIDWLINNLIKRNELPNVDKLEKVDVTFFGGEPTLLYDDIIVPLVQYAEEKYPNKVQFSITTNGTLLNKNRIDFLSNHNIIPLLSIDGAKETQDFNRPQRNGEGSFDLVEANIDYLLDKFPNTTFRATLYQPTVKNLYENYLYATKKGFKNIFICPNAREKWTEEHIKELEIEIGKIFADRILCYLNDYNPIGCTLIDKAFCDILVHDLQIYKNDFNNLNIERNVYRCGIGTGSASVSYEGLIFGCQEQDSRDTNDYFYIGDIFNGIDVERHKKILNDYNKQIELVCEEKEFCNTCPLRTVCLEDICPSVSHDMFNEFFIRPKIDCVFHRAIMSNAVAAMKILVDEAHNDKFKEYLDKIFENYKKGAR